MIFWKSVNRKKIFNRLEEFVYMAEKGTPLEDSFGFPQDSRLGKLLNRLVVVYRRTIDAKESISAARALVVKESQENIRQKKDLTNNINHELKTPVSIINGYLDTILSNPDISDAQRKSFIQKCYDQVQCLTNLLQDLSSLTRMDEARDMIEKERLSLSDLVTETVQDLSARYPGRMYIVNRLPKGISITGNRALLQSIFNNLLENSILYSGGSEVTVSLEERTDEQLTLSVKDNGIGIEGRHLDRIFERFYRVDKGRSRKLGGTGLGLSIVKNAVLIHGGSIRAVPVATGGIQFLFTLDVRKVQDPEAAETSSGAAE